MCYFSKCIVNPTGPCRSWGTSEWATALQGAFLTRERGMGRVRYATRPSGKLQGGQALFQLGIQRNCRKGTGDGAGPCHLSRTLVEVLNTRDSRQGKHGRDGPGNGSRVICLEGPSEWDYLELWLGRWQDDTWEAWNVQLGSVALTTGCGSHFIF